MKKKVCHITSVHNRYDTRIFLKECVSLAKNNFDVTFIVNDNKPDEEKEGVKIVSTKFNPRNRFERFLKSSKILLDKALKVDAKIYHLHDPDLLPLGNKLISKGKKVIFDSHEDVPLQIRGKGWLPKMIRSLIAIIYERYEKASVKKYSALISVTPHIVERLKSINSNTVMVTNYPIVDEDEDVARNPTKSICFAGGISKQWNHILILKSIENIEDIEYVLAGKGSNEYLNRLKSLAGWNKVKYKGVVSHKEVKNIYSISIAGMALNYSVQAKKIGTLGNTKLFEFMEARLPVICSNYLLWKEIIDEYKCGIYVDPNNIEEIKNAINFIIDNPEKAKAMGENGRQAVLEKYNWSIQEEILLKLYEELLL